MGVTRLYDCDECGEQHTTEWFDRCVDWCPCPDYCDCGPCSWCGKQTEGGKSGGLCQDCEENAEEEQMQQRLVIGWSTFLRDCQTLIHILNEMTTFDCIAAVTRGGLVPAAIVARALDIRYIDTVCIALYDEECRKEQGEVLKGIDRAVSQSKRWLVIDEIADSGRTARVARKMMPAGSVFASVYAKPAGIDSIDVHAVTIGQGRWLVMPWEITQS